MKKQEEKFRLHDVYWACAKDGSQVVPYIFNTTHTRIKRLDSGEIIKICYAPGHGNPCAIAGRTIFDFQPVYEYTDKLTQDYMSFDVLKRCSPQDLHNSKNSILKKYRMNLMNYTQRARHYTAIRFSQEEYRSAKDITDLASELQSIFEQQFQAERNKQKVQSSPIIQEHKPDAYEQQFDF